MRTQSLTSVSALAQWTVVALAITAGSLAHASTDVLKFGVVDMQRALQTVDAGKKAKEKLEKESQQRAKELKTEEEAIRKLGEEFRKQSLVMSEDARRKKEGELQERFMKFQNSVQGSQQEFRKKEEDMTRPIIERLRGIIQEQAKKGSYSMILEKNEQMVLFSLPKDDLTEEVIGAFNKAAK